MQPNIAPENNVAIFINKDLHKAITALQDSYSFHHAKNHLWQMLLESMESNNVRIKDAHFRSNLLFFGRQMLELLEAIYQDE